MTAYGISAADQTDPYALTGRPSSFAGIRLRLMLMVSGFVLLFCVLLVRTISLGLEEGGVSRPAPAISKGAQAPAVATLVPEARHSRADLIDRTGVLLGTSLESSALSVNPRKIDDPDRLARTLAKILPARGESWYREQLTSSSSFRWLARQLTPRQKVAINAIGEPALVFHKTEERVYPHGRLFAHALGRVSVDGAGVSGVEKYFDDRLREAGRLNEPLQLSLDARVQYALTDELSAAMRAHKAKGAAGIVMDVRSGEIVAIKTLPDFDPNLPAETIDNTQRFQVSATKGAYELGSIFKTFTMAAALEDGLVDFATEIDATKPLRVAGGHWIRDDHPKARVLTLPEAYVYSSNIASAKIALDLGQERQEQFLRSLGFLARPTIEVPEVTAAFAPDQWHEVETMTIAYGHGITASPLQLVQAMATMVNGGRRVDATLVKKDGPHHQGEAVISPATSRKVRQLMRLAVEKGTGGYANAVGYRVGGKTGTAEIAVGGGYARGRVRSSFLGAFPMDDPRYVVFTMLEEPKGNERTHGFAGAGWTAAPIVGNVVSRIAPILGVHPAREDQSLYQRAALLIEDD